MRPFVPFPATWAILFFTYLALPLAAQQKSDPVARAKIVAPYLEEDVMLVGRIDLGRLNTDALAENVKRLVPDLARELDLDESPQRVEQVKTMFMRVGIREVYLVQSLADLPSRGPFVICPVTAGKDAAAAAKALRAFAPPKPGVVCEAWGRVVFFCYQTSFKRLKERTAPAMRPELAKAFAATGDAAVAVLLLPSDDHRRVVDEMMPRLPPGLGGGSTKPLTEGFRFAALGIDVAPQLSIRLVVQAKDQPAAAAQRAIISKLLEFLGGHPLAKDVPNFEGLTKPLLPRQAGDRLILELNAKNKGTAALVAAAQPFVQQAQNTAQQHEIVNSLKQIGLAMHNYHDVNMSLPAAANYDKDGKPLLSWRVHILPYVEGLDLYKQFRRDEPWDSEHNKKLIAKMPKVYRSSGGKLKVGHTTFLAPFGEKTAFSGKKGIRFNQITDGLSNTLMVLQAPDAMAVPWTKPADWKLDPEKPLKGFFDKREVFFAVFCDGAAQTFNKDLTADTFRAILTRNGGEPVR